MNKHDLNKIRRDLGLTQKAFGELTGYSKKTIECWSSGSKISSKAEKVIRAAYLKVKI